MNDENWLEKIKNIEDIHPADFLESLKNYTGDKKALLRELPNEYITLLIDEAEEEDKYTLLSYLPDVRQESIVNEMSSDELADLLGTIEDEIEKIHLLTHLSDEDAMDVKALMEYDEETAGGIMATEYVSISEDFTISNTIAFLREASPSSETPYYIYVVDEMGILKGVVSLRDIIISTPETLIKEIMNPNAISVAVDTDQEEVGNLFEKYGFMAMPVVNDEGVLLGIVTFDDILEILQDEYTEDLFRLAGMDEEEKLEGTIRGAVRSRLPWLILNLFTALLAAAMVTLFEGTIAKIVTLAAFMPIVAGMGGNAGTQTLTMMVRGIALGELTFENQKSVLLKEAAIGIINGLVLGLLIGTLGFIWEKDLYFGVVIGIAIFLNLIVATLSGSFIPLLLKKLKIDPALASSIFVTTVTDVLGFFFFLGLATLLLL